MTHAHRISIVCANCNRTYEKRADRVQSPDYCGLPCRKIAAAQERQKRVADCVYCGSSFMPRIYQLSIGQGKFCSLKCSNTANIGSRNGPEAKKKAIATYRANGHDKRPKGQDNPLWTGGPRAARKRRILSGKSAKTLAAYRAANPHRVREWTQTRRSGMTGRLLYGTVPKLLTAQRSRCIYCRKSLIAGYHVDHIMPLKLGGKHEASNIQLLCPTCNVRKSARHPVAFAQMNGMLL